jgi:hypothetical protein
MIEGEVCGEFIPVGTLARNVLQELEEDQNK